MKKTYVILIAFIICIVAFGGVCNAARGHGFSTINPKRGDAYPLQITDSYHRKVTISREPKRVISLAPNITEIICALGQRGKLVGRTDYCDYPPEVSRVASVGNIMEPNLEKMIQLHPDLVIASTHFQKTVLQKLEDAGIRVVIFCGETGLGGVYQSITQIGKTLHASGQACRIIAAMRAKVRMVQTWVHGKPRPQVYYVVGFGKSGDYTAGKDTLIGNMLTMAGGANVAEDVRGWQYSLEELMEKNPDLLICSRYFHTREALVETPGYRDLPAVKSGKVYVIDNNLLDRQGPRLADGLESLARIIHPEAFTPKKSRPGQEP